MTNEFHLIIGIDLLTRLLSFDHRERPSAESALGKLSQSFFFYIKTIH
jgi:hypothetical protein